MQRLLAATALLLLAPCASRADTIILDPEIHEVFQSIAAPLRPHMPHTQDTRFMLINNPELNAFATPENIAYIHSGLILRLGDMEELRGVMAHEMGHISHLDFLKGQDAMRRTTIGMIGGMIAGVGAAAAGAPQAAGAIMMGSQAGGMAAILSHTRTQEQEADAAARSALADAGFSALPMARMFDKLRIESQLSYDSPPPYLLTHPLPADRASNIRGYGDTSGTTAYGDPSPTADFIRFQAKVYALTNTTGATLRKYPGNTFPELYARLWADIESSQPNDAGELLQRLEKLLPNDPWLLDAAANIAFIKNDFPAALEYWQALARQYPANPVISMEAAEAARAIGNTNLAAELYQKTVRIWPDWSEPWYGLGLILGQQGHLVSSHLALAESYLGAGDKPEALQSLHIAREEAKTAKPSVTEDAWLRDLGERLHDEPKGDKDDSFKK